MRIDKTPFLRPRLLQKVLLIAITSAALAATGCSRNKPAEGASPAANQGGQPAAAKGAAGPGRPAGAAGTSSMTITTTQVKSLDIVRSVPATGSIHPWQEVIVSAEVGGYRVAEVLVDVGTRVSKGQPLVRLSGDMLQADLDSKRAALRSAEAALVNASAALRRGEQVRNSGALSAADLDKLTADQIAAQARVETARADVTTSELRARYGTVTAPDSGVVTSRTVSVGQIAQAGAEMLRMLRQNRVEWRAEVPEAQLSRIKVGQNASITAVDGTVLAGRVRAVAPTVQTTNRTGLVYVDIIGEGARPGMFARGQIDVGKGPALLLPVASVVMQDGYSYVFVLKGANSVERRRVQQVGVRGDDMEVSDGVAAGDVIAVKGAGFLKDGDTITVNNAAPAA
ncbi:MAG: efflux RND transporter periplasmic adaptor subunit [Gammaproteobacteria bacterium]|nr:efflux RND transporter periplasmic adaptor subunit [Gammaproteobacteria bacterium]